MALVQLLRRAGVHPIHTTRHETTATDVLKITSDNFAPQIEKLTGGKGISLVFDAVGDAGLFQKSLDSLLENGR